MVAKKRASVFLVPNLSQWGRPRLLEAFRRGLGMESGAVIGCVTRSHVRSSVGVVIILNEVQVAIPIARPASPYEGCQSAEENNT